ncbi:phosphoglycerate mutase-like protein [Basidiobolus meristosporus CBS 931.73]|uniref:Phosphoglycerate mutase-like protein n=1 Tax=Basidiobolus meristosporus CBS 931.73 TaxID=1314790 RepID=A0A1Y1XT32_9FUNG|nr:phosphoglycerate mutase-like protein [Basidiobolus meristosporus CBS 931.73]|eukprot:ORX88855.1 phosphoglycerate mutase-like protein [Basidiobolus meristosporus CBS 931.73]
MKHRFIAWIYLGAFPVSLASYEIGVNEHYCSATTPTAETYSVPKGVELRHVQVIVRHGDRTPISILPQQSKYNVLWNCTNEAPEFSYLKLQNFETSQTYGLMLDNSNANPFSKEYITGTCMTGQLTPKGMRQQQNVGKKLREIYVDLLGYLPRTLNRRNLQKAIFVRHTEKTRTKQTAIALVSGLYPKEKLQGRLGIPLFYLPEQIETMIYQSGLCSRLAKLQEAMLNEKRYNEYWGSQQEVKKKMDAILQTTTTPAYQGRSLVRYMDAFRPLTCNNYPLPCSLDNSNQCISDEMAVRSFVGNDFEAAWTMRDSPLSHEANRLGIGLFLSELRRSIHNSLGKGLKSPAKMEIFSGHDTTVQPILGVLRADDFRWPPYASSLIFELWQDKHTGAAFLRVLYNGDVLRSPVCDFNLCPLETFLSQIDHYIPLDILTECKQSS